MRASLRHTVGPPAGSSPQFAERARARAAGARRTRVVMGLAHGDRQLAFPGSVQLAETRVAVPSGSRAMYSFQRIDSVTCLRLSSRWMLVQSGSLLLLVTCHARVPGLGAGAGGWSNPRRANNARCSRSFPKRRIRGQAATVTGAPSPSEVRSRSRGSSGYPRPRANDNATTTAGQE